MSTSVTPYSIVDSAESVVGLIDTIQAITAPGPHLFLDLEGVSLSRNGTISLVAIFVDTENRVFLVDVTTLRSAAFTTANKDGTTLKAILESPTIIKVFFDLRNDSDALNHHFGIRFAGVEDVQLMEFASQAPGRKRFVTGLEKCIDNTAPLSWNQKQAWKAAKDKGLRLFHPSQGDSYKVFNTRPLSNNILQYCINNICFLPQLKDTLWERLSPAWKSKVVEETARRVMQSQSPTYQPQLQDKALGLWNASV